MKIEVALVNEYMETRPNVTAGLAVGEAIQLLMYEEVGHKVDIVIVREEGNYNEKRMSVEEFLDVYMEDR